MLYLPVSDPDACVEFIEEFGDKPGVLGFLVTCVRYQPIHENRLMQMFAALNERGLPLAFHSAPNWGERSFEQLNRFIGVHALGFPFYAMVQLTNLVYNGIPERFPNIRCCSWRRASRGSRSWSAGSTTSTCCARPRRRS